MATIKIISCINYDIVVNELDSGSTMISIEFYSPDPLDAAIDSMIVTVVELVELMHPVYMRYIIAVDYFETFAHVISLSCKLTVKS